MSRFTVTLELRHPPAALFRFLADPRNRPLWQSSLRSVVDVDDGDPRPGLRWRDVTKVGVRPAMQITELTPFRVLGEVGTWHGVTGVLTLHFVQTQQGTRLTAAGEVTGRGPYAVAAYVSGRLAARTIRQDLLRASEVLASR